MVKRWGNLTKCPVRRPKRRYEVNLMMNLQDKGKTFPVHAIKSYRWSRVTAPLLLNLGNRWE